MKPRMIFSFGGWSASTPLQKTLIKNKVVCKPVIKEPNILPSIIQQNSSLVLGKYIHCKENNKEGYEVFRCNTIDKYIDWLLRRYHNNDCGAVSDATNTHAYFDVNDIAKFATKFKEVFDVKVLIICRNPVRRLFSHLNAIGKVLPIPDGHSLDNLGQNERLECVMDYLSKPAPVHFPGQLKNYRQGKFEPFMDTNYPEIISNWSQFFDTHVICMEDLWGDKREALQRLNTFLGTNITKLTPNVYYPELGPNAPRLEGLKDQWISDTEFITEKNYNLAREKLNWVYEGLTDYWA
tara:strand:- start:585 stop:1466 length:882 start_codon:yes stop_codon:yes gene_type:complete